jgi:frataxin-like iron-binding protein CyaY
LKKSKVVSEKIKNDVCDKKKWWSDCDERRDVLEIIFSNNSKIIRKKIRK